MDGLQLNLNLDLDPTPSNAKKKRSFRSGKSDKTQGRRPGKHAAARQPAPSSAARPAAAGTPRPQTTLQQERQPPIKQQQQQPLKQQQLKQPPTKQPPKPQQQLLQQPKQQQQVPKQQQQPKKQPKRPPADQELPQELQQAEQAELMELVRLNMAVDQHIQEDLQQQRQQQQRKRRRTAAASDDSDDDDGGAIDLAADKSYAGVVEFGNAPDEADPLSLARKGRAPAAGRKDERSQRQQPQQRQQQQQQQQLRQHKMGDMAHAEPNVPAAARAQLFGSAAAGDAAADGSWSGLGLSEQLMDHLVALNYQEPTQVQQQTIPVLLAGRDALVRSATGSGKTLAYLAPIIQQLQAHQPRISRADGSHAIILVPTRELAVQVNDVLTAAIRRFCWLVPGMLIGGEHRGHEKARLRKGVTVLVASPGRLLDHLQNTASFKTSALRWLVLDEADRLLDLGFEAKLAEIIAALNARLSPPADDADGGDGDGNGCQRQTVLLSATLHPRLASLAQLSLQEPVTVGFEASALQGSAAGEAPPQQEPPAADAAVQFDLPQQLQQRYLEVPAKMRLAALVGVLRRMMQRGKAAKVVVFFATCAGVDFHHQLLQQLQGSDAGGEQQPTGQLLGGSLSLLKLHGDMKQPERTSSLVTFAKAHCCVLCCTDVAARGLDFPGVSAILQYDPPGEPSEYVHRVGRTARMGQQGQALLFLLPTELAFVELLQQHGVEVAPERPAQALQGLMDCTRQHSNLQKLAKKLSTTAAARGAARGCWDAASRDQGEMWPEILAAAQLVQQQLVQLVGADAELGRLASAAFRSFVRAYAAHPAALKHIFHVRSLHLGHLAASFGLREAPGAVGASGAAAARKRRKVEQQAAVLKKEKVAWHRSLAKVAE